MRIRDISQAGFYVLPGATGIDQRLPEEHNRAQQFQVLHVICVAPMFVTELSRFAFIPITETTSGDAKLVDPDTLFSDDDDWLLLCDASEPDFRPHTFLMKLMELAGYSEDDARRIARDTLVQDLDRQIYGSA